MKWLYPALILMLIAMAAGLGLLAYAMYALLGAMLVSWLMTRVWTESLAAERQCNRTSVNVGQQVAVVVSVKNEGKLPVAWVLIEDLLPRHALVHRPPTITVHGSRLQLAMLRSGGRKTFPYQVEFNQRGYYQIGPLVLETGDLFGLHRRWRSAADPDFVLVYPEVVPLDGYDVSSRRPIGEIRITHRLFEDPTRISGVRAYQPGDPINRVHWRATADRRASQQGLRTFVRRGSDDRPGVQFCGVQSRQRALPVGTVGDRCGLAGQCPLPDEPAGRPDHQRP